MNNVTITVRGMGRYINYETILIKRALEQAGIQVDLQDEHPYTTIEPGAPAFATSDDEFLAKMTAHLKSLPERFQSSRHVTIVTEHLPWGG